MKKLSLFISCLFGLISLNAQNQADYSPFDDGKFLSDKIHNPIANIATIPIEYWLSTHNKNTNVFNFLPSIPVNLSKKWMMVTRATIPVINAPTSLGYKNGFGNIILQSTVTHAEQTGTTWGAGPAIMFPAINERLGFNKLSVGPSITVLKQTRGFTYGLTAQNFFSVVGSSTSDDVNYLWTQIIVSKNLKNDWYLYSNPHITANWNAVSNEQWTIPLGIGAGKLITHNRYLPINLKAGFYKYVAHPTDADWLIQIQATFILNSK